MGNSIWCSASGEHLASAARDGDLIEAKLLLENNRRLVSCSSSAVRNSPLHLAAANGHAEMVMLLLENGADVNSRNFCGQTVLMQACRRGHWEVVQALLLYGTNVTKAEFLSRKTALHFAAAGGYIRCIRLLVADFVPSAPYGANILSSGGEKGRGSSSSGEPESSGGIKLGLGSIRVSLTHGPCFEPCHGHILLVLIICQLSRFVNKVADAGMTALHLAALHGHSDCAQLLLDLHANVSAETYSCGFSLSKMIGVGSTPLHFAACGGNLKCCQVLLARGACRLTLNYNGWLPVDIAKLWGHRYLVPLLSPHSDLKIPRSPPSNYLSLPLLSVLNIARECRLKSLTPSSDEDDLCAICLENTCSVAAEGCAHELCVKCALDLCSACNITSQVGGPPGSIPCPLCRNGVVSFVKLAHNPGNEAKLTKFKSICNPCPQDPQRAAMTCRSEFCGSYKDAEMEAPGAPDLNNQGEGGASKKNNAPPAGECSRGTPKDAPTQVSDISSTPQRR